MSRTDLDAALSGAAWSFGGVVFGLDRVLDEEGRPVTERRAPSEIKKGVAIELRPCPYADERHGGPMNVSALAQISRHFEDVMEEVRRFRGLMPSGEPSWDRMLTAVVDQLSAPARYLLDERSASLPVPARSAVGCKLAQGYFGVLRKRLVAEARGDHLPVSAESFGAFVRAESALVGASEVCAGPPHMIARASRVFIEDAPLPASDLPRKRLEIARLLAQQVRVGIAWELFDLAAERRFLVDDVGIDHMRPRNPFIAGELQRRVKAFEEGTVDAGSRLPILPETLSEDRSSRLRAALDENGHADPFRKRTKDVVEELFANEGGAIELTVPGASALLGEIFADYVVALRAFIEVLCELERELRVLLGFPPWGPIRLHGSILPKPKALRWYETVLGYAIRSELSSETELIVGNHLRVVSIPAGVRGRQRRGDRFE